MSWYPEYVDPGMRLITREEAEKRFADGKETYCLFDDNTESLIEKEEDLDRSNLYGVERDPESFNFREYADNRREMTGRVLFGHSSDSAVDLLSLAERLFHLLKGSHISNDDYDIVDTAEDLCKEYKEYYAFDEEPKACWRMAVCLINKLIPDEYRLVLTDEDFGDWEFIKIREE